MKKIYLYIKLKALKYFLATLLVSSVFIFIINLFEGINFLTKKDIQISEILSNTLYTTPLYIYLLTPLITMIASVLTFNYFKTTSEYKAILSAGYSPTIFLKNILYIVFIICFFMIFFIDKHVSDLYLKSVKKSKILPHLTAKYNNAIIDAKISNKTNMSSVYISKASSLKIYAERMEWEKNIWKAYNVAEVIQTQNGLIYQNKKSIDIDFLPPPEDLIIEEILDTNSYSISRLIERLNKLKKLSMNHTQEEVLIYFRIGVILLNIISAIAAFLIFKTKLINNKGTAISASILFSLIIWFIITVFKRTADMELIPCWTVGFIPHLLVSTILLKISSKLNLRI